MATPVTERSGARAHRSILATRPLLGWRTVDILTVAFLGAAFGVAFWGWGVFYNGPVTALKIGYAPLMGLFAGPWFLAGVVGGLVVRRPGAALFCEVVAALVSMLPGTEWGATVLVSGILQGLGAELAFAVLGYSAFGAAAAALAGVLSAPLEWAFEVVRFPASWADVPVLSVARGRRRLVRRVGPHRQARLPRGHGGLGCRARRARRLAARAGAGPGGGAVGLPGRAGAPGAARCLTRGRMPSARLLLPTAVPHVAASRWTPSPGGPSAGASRCCVTSRSTLRPGERVLLVGPSGSGKSTLLRALAGLLETVDAGELSGSVLVDGAAPGERPGAVGLVLQEPGAGVVAATVGRDVAFGPENVGMPRAAMPAVVSSALASVGLGDLPLDTPTSALSGGQTQRLALAGTLALDPSVVLLDEPTAMLDPGSAQEVRDAVAALTSDGGRPVEASEAGGPAGRHPSPTLVVVEHVLAPWVDLVERLVVLSADGRVVADGPVAETLGAQRERLLAMGIWVPGEGPPPPVFVDPALVAPREPFARRPPPRRPR